MKREKDKKYLGKVIDMPAMFADRTATVGYTFHSLIREDAELADSYYFYGPVKYITGRYKGAEGASSNINRQKHHVMISKKKGKRIDICLQQQELNSSISKQ